MKNSINQQGIIGQDIFGEIAKASTINRFKQRCDFEKVERLMLSNPLAPSKEL